MTGVRSAEKSSISNRIKILVILIPLILPLAACKDNQATSDDLSIEEPIPVHVLSMQSSKQPIGAETIAQTEGAKEVEIRPRVGGILLKRLYTEGTPIKAGQPLFLIDPVPFENTLAEARAQFLEQQIRVARAEREEQRGQALVSKNFISQRAYDGIMAEHMIEKAALKSAKARVQQAELNLSYTTVTAPVDGITGRSQFSEGALITASTSLLTNIIQVSPIWVRFSFSDNELARFGGRLTEHNIQHVTITLTDGSEYSHKGNINFAASQIDPLLGTQQLRATFENSAQRLLPGQFVRVRVAAVESVEVFLVPQIAVLTSDFGRYVYLVNEKNEAIQQPVVAGDWVGQKWIILQGLNPGDRVIIDNIIRLRSGKAVTVITS